MISLQIALLIAGIVVFCIVLIISYDKVRRTKSQLQPSVDGDNEPAIILNNTDSTRESDLLLPENKRSYKNSIGVQNSEPQLKPEFLDNEEQSPSESATEGKNWREELQEAEIVAKIPIGGVSELDDESAAERLPIEYVVRLPGKNVVKRDAVLGIYRQHEFELSKSHRIFGLSHPARMWCDLEKQPETARFTDVGMTIQLANRDGPVSESDLNRFSQIALTMAEVFGRRIQFSCELDQAVNQAQHLDELIKKYDTLAILSVSARNSVFLLADIDETARSMGLVQGEKNIYKRYEGSRLCYRLANLDPQADKKMVEPEGNSTRGLTLFMNIPKTKDPAQVFARMIDDAKEFCKRLDGKLVDQNQRGMTQKGLKRISGEIRQMSVEMEREGIPPGGDLCLKLF